MQQPPDPRRDQAGITAGIEEFAPVVRDTALAIMSADAGGMAVLRARHPREVHAVRLIHAGVA